jgi:two-component system, NtrC family, nitrogen regulation response regulator NtrX
MNDTVLIVDDEDNVRRTFQEWLLSLPDVQVFAVADAESALMLANQHPIDLAVLDWNLGSGTDGLRLLEDLAEFQPDIVAILVTGFANQATPLDALRMGVRDYLDKAHDLTRESFLRSVRKQLEKIRPAKRQRELNASLAAFREAVEKVLPLVQSSAALNDPVPLPVAVQTLFRFLLRATGAGDGMLIVRHLSDDGGDTTICYAPNGEPVAVPAIPFNLTLASSVLSLQEPCVLTDLEGNLAGMVELLPFEKNRKSILAAPVRVGQGLNVILELFEKAAFTDEDRRLVSAASDLGAELLRQVLSERRSLRVLFDAVQVALSSSERVHATLNSTAESRSIEPPPPAVWERIKLGLSQDNNSVADPDTSLRLIESVRVLALRHGPYAVEHCLHLVESVRKLLDQSHSAE